MTQITPELSDHAIVGTAVFILTVSSVIAALWLYLKIYHLFINETKRSKRKLGLFAVVNLLKQVTWLTLLWNLQNIYVYVSFSLEIVSSLILIILLTFPQFAYKD